MSAYHPAQVPGHVTVYASLMALIGIERRVSLSFDIARQIAHPSAYPQVLNSLWIDVPGHRGAPLNQLLEIAALFTTLEYL